MDQQIRFCTSQDGVRIAYATLGEGEPLVVVSGWVSHLQFEWSQPKIRKFWSELANGRLLVRADRRGTGLSDWDARDLSMGARLADLDAVIRAVGFEHVSLMGISEGAGTSIAYAAEHPQRVSRLVVYGGYPRFPTSLNVLEPLCKLVEAEWGMGSAALSNIFLGSSEPADIAAYNELQRVSTSGKNAARTLEATSAIDVTRFLSSVRCPALVLHRRGDRLHPFELAREIASTIPDAQLHPLEGDIYWPWLGDTRSILNAIQSFVPGGKGQVVEGDLPSGTAVILFTDIADSTALTERMGDAAFREASRALDERCRVAIGDAGGTPIEGKVLGDGVMAVFTSARQAIDAALRCQAATDGTGLELHVGVHAGDVIRDGNNVYGGAVNVAARIAGASAAGETLVSATVRDLARTSAGVAFEDRGEHALKGIEDAQRLYAVRAREA